MLQWQHYCSPINSKVHEHEVWIGWVRPPFLRFTKFKFRFVDLPFSGFFRFLSKTVQTDQNWPFFWIRRLKFENLGNFLPCSRNTSPGVNKQNGRSANISSHLRAEKGIQTAKVWPQKANKAAFWRKSRWKINFAQHFIESTTELAKVLGKYGSDHFTKAYLPFSVFYSPIPWILSVFRIMEEWRLNRMCLFFGTVTSVRIFYIIYIK